jgi:hypothetical protein
MISVIVYGRNDAHWSNIHKRAAISLNALAHVLDDRDDEIVFVDYNTSDDLPTFPEAIADTLTDKARGCLRVLRVRPRDHARLSMWTPLPVVEALARNVALRRMSPSNPWVLLTNTDCVIAPLDGARSLTRVVGDLDGEFYCNPRYEVPEVLWGTANRLDPASVLDDFVAWSHRLRLRAVALGHEEAIFDYPGDFQLVASERLRGLSGIDERLLLVGECDIDLAKRLRAQGVSCGTLMDRVDVFHCSHTRGATPSSTARRLTNNRFDEDWADPGFRWEPGGDWGLAAARVEEVRLGKQGARPFVRALGPILADEPAEPVPLRPYSLPPVVLACQTGHVLPYVADLFWTRARQEVVGYVGLNQRMADSLARVLEEMGFDAPLERVSLDDPPSNAVARLSKCDALVFDFGVDERDLDAIPAESALDRLIAMYPLLEGVAREERSARDNDPGVSRLHVFIHLELSPFKAAVEADFDLVVAPLMTRITHGRVRDAVWRPVGPNDLARTLGRASMSVAEFEATRERLRLLVERGPADKAAFERYALRPPLFQLARLMVERAFEAPDRERLTAVWKELERRRPIRRLRERSGMTTHGTTRPALSKLASILDWDDPEWGTWARRLRPGVDWDSYLIRRDYDWDRAQILYALDRLGQLTPASRILIRTGGPDPAITLIGRYAGAVDACVDTSEGIRKGPAGAPWASAPPTVTWRVMDADYAPEAPYSAIVVMRNLAQKKGRPEIGGYVKRMDPWLEPGGVLILVLDVTLGKNLVPPLLTGQDWDDGRWIDTDVPGYSPVEPVIQGLDPMTWDCLLPIKHMDSSNPVFLRQVKRATISRSVIVLRKSPVPNMKTVTKPTRKP